MPPGAALSCILAHILLNGKSTIRSMVTRGTRVEHVLPLAVAHQGGNESAHDNTIEAFQDTLGFEYRRGETDVHFTRHSELLAIHTQSSDGSKEARGLVEIEDHLVLAKEFLEAKGFVERECNAALWFVVHLNDLPIRGGSC